MTEREAYVAFNLTEKIGSVGVAQLVAEAGDVVSAWERSPNRTARAGGDVDWSREFKLAKKFGVEIVTPADPAYPPLLREAPSHPLALYVKGNVEALSQPGVAMVGTRRATPYGRDQAFKIAEGLAELGWSVVSGLALGIDAESHRGALAAGGTTVGVLGSALDCFYPEENRELAREIVQKGGAVVSEFAFGRAPDEHTFPQRNHVVAALVRGVVAVEAPFKSGTLITTSIAADLGRTVMAVPGRVDSRSSQGCLALIRDGARLVRSAKDVDEELSDLLPDGRVPRPASRVQPPSSPPRAPQDTPQPPRPAFSVEEAMILREVDAEGVTMDELVRRTKLPAAKVNALCMSLRLKSCVRFFPGNRVALPRTP